MYSYYPSTLTPNLLLCVPAWMAIQAPRRIHTRLEEAEILPFLPLFSFPLSYQEAHNKTLFYNCPQVGFQV